MRGSFSRIDWSTLPNGDCVMRRTSRYEITTTVSTNQWKVVGVKRSLQRPRSDSRGWPKVSPFSPPVTSVQVKMMT